MIDTAAQGLPRQTHQVDLFLALLHAPRSGGLEA